jgi:hypothetical protein
MAVALVLAACGGGTSQVTAGRSSASHSGGAETPSSATASPVAIPRPITDRIPVDQAPAVALALSGLGTGPRPRIPWTEGRTLHLGRHAITPAPYLTYDATPGASAPYGTGAVVEVWDRNPLIIWYDEAGKKIRQSLFSDGLGWSPTFHEVAWTNPRGEVVVASSTTGRILHRYRPPHPAPAPTAAGWLGPGDLLFPVGYGVPRGWRTSGDAVAGEPAFPVATSAGKGVVAGVLGRTRRSDEACLAAWHVDDPQSVLWVGCLTRRARFYNGGLSSFSPDGRLFAASAGIPGRGASQPFVAVLDARTGAAIARLDQGRNDGSFRGPQYAVNAMRWEDDTHLLLVVADRTQAVTGRDGAIEPLEALVRCDVRAVSCELATTPRRTSQMGTAAYGLVGGSTP